MGIKSKEEAIKYLVDNNVSIREIAEAYPNEIAVKIWQTEDVRDQMGDMNIPAEIIEELFYDAVAHVENNYSGALEACTDEDWEAIECGIRDAIDERGLIAYDISWDINDEDIISYIDEVENAADILQYLGIEVQSQFAQAINDNNSELAIDIVMNYFHHSPGALDNFMENVVNLPLKVQIPAGIYDTESISDWLSDEYGFCHKDFRIKTKI